MDSQLVIQAQGGDRSAFGELAASFGDRLYAVAFRILRDADLAQDDIPVGTVGSRLHAAKRALRAGLDADARTAKAGGRTA
ncbi:MAG: hypothetical protein LC798_20630 [Chloroflexi bacterium]|nr:hypothetical protein [Chloroflexota bacterium]